MAKFFSVPVFGNVSVEAYDEDDAVKRVEKVLARGSIAPFAFNTPLPEKILSSLDIGDDVYFLHEEIPAHEELHTDVGDYDESIMRRLKPKR